MILGRPWHEVYDPDISWKDGGHLRPRPESQPTNSMSADDGSRERRTHERVHFKDPPQETDSGSRTTTDSGRGGRKLGIGRQRRRRTDAEVAVISVDAYGQTEFVDWVATFEAAAVSAGNDKFAYYQDAKVDDKTGQVPDEYQGHPAFHAKHMEGLPDHGP
ncbi:hypothetical protein C8A05DRAFT_20439, partial [Staphylotrichum tortipilum]